ncbi:MAG: hypothetical protein II711_02015 [Clostridia bacterium]|nr:hypothetical protein [Clostridia bacterium]
MKKKNTSNLIFSAFLVTAYVICAFFFVGLIRSSTGLDTAIQTLLMAGVFFIFGLLLFYATRIGDGKQIKRFSLATLILMDLPALYIILASAASGLPFPLDLSRCPEIIYFAGVALGYGIPYTFVSGYEQEVIDEEPNKPEKSQSSDESQEEKNELPEGDNTESNLTEETETTEKTAKSSLVSDTDSDGETEE